MYLVHIYITSPAKLFPLSTEYNYKHICGIRLVNLDQIFTNATICHALSLNFLPTLPTPLSYRHRIFLVKKRDF